MHFPSRYSCLLFVLPTNIIFVFAPCICLSSPPPTVSVLLLSCGIASSVSLPPFVCHLHNPLWLTPHRHWCFHLPSAPQKHVLIFSCQPTSLAVIYYFCAGNYCPIWPPFLLTFGQHLLFGKPFSLMKQYTCFYNFKVVLPRMLCPYQFKGGSSPVLCDVHNAKWRKKQKQKKYLKLLQNYYEMVKKKSASRGWRALQTVSATKYNQKVDLEVK